MLTVFDIFIVSKLDSSVRFSESWHTFSLNRAGNQTGLLSCVLCSVARCLIWKDSALGFTYITIAQRYLLHLNWMPTSALKFQNSRYLCWLLLYYSWVEERIANIWLVVYNWKWYSSITPAQKWQAFIQSLGTILADLLGREGCKLYALFYIRFINFFVSIFIFFIIYFIQRNFNWRKQCAESWLPCYCKYFFIYFLLQR